MLLPSAKSEFKLNNKFFAALFFKFYQVNIIIGNINYIILRCIEVNEML